MKRSPQAMPTGAGKFISFTVCLADFGIGFVALKYKDMRIVL